MGLSYNTASSILLCAEDNNSILCFEDEIEEQENGRGWAPQEQRNDFYGDFLMGFPLQSDECLDLMVKREAEHLPREDYGKRLITGALDISIRRDAVDWIWKVHSYYSFGPLSAYLSVNYLDRFLSAYELPQGKAWMTQLLSVACLSLAAKMEESEVPLCLDLQVREAKYVFEPRTIQRMELLVLSTLKWRMQAVTPFSFIDYFLHKLNGGDPPTKPLLSTAAQLILSTARGIEFLAFKPSEIAAAVAMSALGEAQVVEIDKAAASCNYVDKERLLRCYEVIQEVVLMRSGPLRNDSTASISSVSPNGVLDAARCMSFKSDDMTVGSHAHSYHSSPANKRRKLSRPPVS
ncbi:cyclin-D4-1-like [Asparagus officinalis]|uniref:cyclin-D4-1-like n=1 Tax=Asparagus officinalis TaxID=4686 RepID=UPI00098E43E8|nr:cyclin-D4-1-like [Asparagus officinalis]